LPAGYTIRAYAYTALCRELRGETVEADRYVDVVRQYLRQLDDYRPPGSSASPVALVLARRGLFEEALDIAPFVPRTITSGWSVAALCEIEAMRGRWDDAPRVAAAAREEALVGKQLFLPLYADRLEGRAAAAAGDVERAAEFLARSAAGFEALEARWEATWSRLLLAELLVDGDPRRAERELATALPVFEELRSVSEIERARATVPA
jgi:hypothetical protein